MKTKIYVVFLVLGTLCSCVDDFNGDGKPDKLTAENTVYEGDLYQSYLEGEIEDLEIEIEELENIEDAGQGNEETREQLAAALALRADFKEEIAAIPSIFFGIIPRPMPPCPRPRNCNLFDRDFFVVPGGSEALEIRVIDANGEIVGGTFDDLQNLPNAEGEIDFIPFTTPSLKGDETIKVNFTDTKGNTRNYAIVLSGN